MIRIFKSLKPYCIILGVILVLYMLLFFVRNGYSQTEKLNDDSTTTQRVFDYADVLTDKEEAKLQKLIEKREGQCETDIVLVTLNEDLRDWYNDNEDEIAKYKYDDDNFYFDAYTNGAEYKEICVYSNVFYDSHKFGFNGFDEESYYTGNGVLLVDNYYDDYSIEPQMWFCTSGETVAAYEKNDAALSWHLIDLVGDLVVISPYLAYKTYVNTVYFDSVGFTDFSAYVNYKVIIAIALIFTVIVTLIKTNSLKAKNTTTAMTYVEGNPRVNIRQDVFIRKTETTRVMSSSSSGSGHGGGGHGGGGHGHGGHGGGH